MRIGYLADHIEHLPTLARWFHDQWGYLSPGYTLEARTARLQLKAKREGMPITFIAMEGDEPIGSASLVECDMSIRDHLKPWMSSVFVAPAYRCRGVATALVEHVVRAAGAQGFPGVYLWTPDQMKFYAKRGWIEIETTEYRNETAVVMRASAQPK